MFFALSIPIILGNGLIAYGLQLFSKTPVNKGSKKAGIFFVLSGALLFLFGTRAFCAAASSEFTVRQFFYGIWFLGGSCIISLVHSILNLGNAIKNRNLNQQYPTIVSQAITGMILGASVVYFYLSSLSNQW